MPRLPLPSVIVLAASVLNLTLFPSDGATVTLSPVKDNTIYEEGAESNGAGNYLFAGKTGDNAQFPRRRALIAFDIAGALPENAIITGVSLTMHLSKMVFGSVTDMSLHRLTKDWGEGASKAADPEGAGAPAATGDVTWAIRFFPDTGTAWTTQGGDYLTSASGTARVGSVFPVTTTPVTWSAAGMIADVQEWADNPAANFGWILLGDESIANGAKRFNSRTNPDAATRPSLTVTYEIIPEPGTAALLGLGAVTLMLRRRRQIS